MRHRVANRKFGLPSDQRMALLRGLVRVVIKHGAIETTEARAKDVRGMAERLITIAKKNDLHSRRMVRRIISDEDIVKELFDNVAPKFADRPGGYLRITKLGFRRGDAAPVVKLEMAID